MMGTTFSHNSGSSKGNSSTGKESKDLWILSMETFTELLPEAMQMLPDVETALCCQTKESGRRKNCIDQLMTGHSGS